MSSTVSVLTTLQNQESAVNWQQLLSEIVSSFDCSTGTIHILDKDANLLRLRAQQGIPHTASPNA